MKLSLTKLLRNVQEDLKSLRKYRYDPTAFCEEVLGITLWAKQREIAEALVKHKRVLVRSANSVGKSKLTACLALWYYMTRDPGITLITAPTIRQIKDIIFKEIRRHYKGAGLYPKQPRIESGPDHYLFGFTTTDETSFQGVHDKNVFVIFEECTGIDAGFWIAAKSILIGGDESYFLAVCNPTDTTSQAYLEEQSGKWHVVSISALEHPNVVAELLHEAPPIPSAVRLEGVEEVIDQWCRPVADFPLPTDFKFRNVWYRPGGIAEARILGRYPSAGACSIFSEEDFNRSSKLIIDGVDGDIIVLGADIARFGDDMTTITVRRGPAVVYHEAYNGKDTAFTARRLKELALRFSDRPKRVPILVDDSGVGGGVQDQRDDYFFIPINGAARPLDPFHYANRRSEAMFNVATLMREGKLSLANLPPDTFKTLKQQAVGIQYSLNNSGRLLVEKKADIKERIGRSPDDLDSLCLCFYPLSGNWTAAGEGVETERKRVEDRRRPDDAPLERPRGQKESNWTQLGGKK